MLKRKSMNSCNSLLRKCLQSWNLVYLFIFIERHSATISCNSWHLLNTNNILITYIRNFCTFKWRFVSMNLEISLFRNFNEPENRFLTVNATSYIINLSNIHFTLYVPNICAPSLAARSIARTHDIIKPQNRESFLRDLPNDLNAHQTDLEADVCLSYFTVSVWWYTRRAEARYIFPANEILPAGRWLSTSFGIGSYDFARQYDLESTNDGWQGPEGQLRKISGRLAVEHDRRWITCRCLLVKESS